MSLARSSTAPGKSFTYALKCFFIMAKLFTFLKISSKSLACSIKVVNRSFTDLTGTTCLPSPRSRRGLGEVEKSHGLPNIARPSITPSQPVSSTFFFASTKFITSPFPIMTVSGLTSLRILTMRFMYSQCAGTLDISLAVRR